ncbi:MAG: chromosome segregation protein SMC, partial [Gammaproteobacteria bacterium]|nr:chromosome segregation protein SMC [Gammaproteobacteria bacterium]
ELQQVLGLWQELEEHIASEQMQLEQLSEQRLQDEPAQEELLMQQEMQADQLQMAEEAMEAWQQQWHDYSQRSAEPLRIAHGERSRMDQLEAQVQRHQQRRERLEGEQAHLDGSELDGEIERWQEQQLSGEAQLQEAEQQLEGVQASLSDSQSRRREQENELNQLRQRQQKQSGRLASLEALQQAALGQQEQNVVSWLEGQNLADRPRLAQRLEVDEGWQQAVETVLADHLEAVCVDQLDPVAPLLESLEHGSLLLLERGSSASMLSSTKTLLSKVRSEENLESLLASVYVADDLPSALQMRLQLQQHESVITPEGIWLGSNWLRIKQDDDKNSGVLARGQEIKTLSADQARLVERIERLEDQLEATLSAVQEQEQQLEELRQSVNQNQREISDAHRHLDSARLRREQLSQRWQRLGEEAEEIQMQLESDQEALQISEQRYHEALQQSEVMAAEGEALRLQQDELNSQLNELRQQARELTESGHVLALRLESNRSALAAAEQSQQRAQAQLLQLSERRETLQQQLGVEEQPVDQLQRELERYLADRVGIEKRLSDAQNVREEIEARQRQQEKQRLEVEQVVNEVRERVQQESLAVQESKVRCGTLLEQLAETDFSLEWLLQELDESASVKIWQPNVEQMAQKIQRLGAINLAAIDEYEEQLQRKEHMQSQYDDINEALLTLETAIAKMDRETRSRFKETFDQVNRKMQHFFPRLFGGGKANLELTDDDLLTAGVTIRAQPPGKRVNNIHLLSGGEKALTAVALVFAFFELNPSPFCMLDEVDAPLDDANVGRFCELVKEMSERVQFIFITHNKSTMELSEQLMGVTMHEAGVSRLVTVNVHEAAKMANG